MLCYHHTSHVLVLSRCFNLSTTFHILSFIVISFKSLLTILWFSSPETAAHWKFSWIWEKKSNAAFTTQRDGIQTAFSLPVQQGSQAWKFIDGNHPSEGDKALWERDCDSWTGRFSQTTERSYKMRQDSQKINLCLPLGTPTMLFALWALRCFLTGGFQSTLVSQRRKQSHSWVARKLFSPFVVAQCIESLHN